MEPTCRRNSDRAPWLESMPDRSKVSSSAATHEAAKPRPSHTRSLPSPIFTTSGIVRAFPKRSLLSSRTLSLSKRSTDVVGPSLPTHKTPWFVPVPSPYILTSFTMRLQEKIMAALIFCSDVHKTGPSRRSSLTSCSSGILSVSRIPRLSMGLSS